MDPPKSKAKVLLLILLIGIAGVVAAIVLSDSENNRTPAKIIQGPKYNPPIREIPQTPEASEVQEIRTPEAESEFILAVQHGEAAFRDAANEMAQGGTRSERRFAVCQALAAQTSVAGWVGQVSKLSSNQDGKGVLSISLADSVTVETWNNDLSDMFDHTLIEPQSPLFLSVSQLGEGDRVVFSGSFIPSQLDCVEESSVSLVGSMTDPEFIFRFRTVDKY